MKEKEDQLKFSSEDIDLMIRILSWCKIATRMGDDQKKNLDKVLFKLARYTNSPEAFGTDPAEFAAAKNE